MKNYISLLTLIVTVNLFAQDPKFTEDFTVAVGDNYSRTDGTIREFYKHEDYVVGINSHKRNLVIQKFDPKTLKELERIEHEKFFNYNTNFEEVVLVRVGDNVVFFYFLWNRKTQTESIETQIVSLIDLKISERKEIISQKGKIEKNGILQKSKYLIKKSFDDQKILIAYRLKIESKDNSDKEDRLFVNIFDSQLMIIWKEQIEIPYSRREMSYIDYAIDRDDNLYLLVNVFKSNNSGIKKRENNYHYELFRVEKNTKTVTKDEIKIGDKFINEIILFEDNNREMILVGTLGTSKKIPIEFESSGIFIIKLNKDGSILGCKNYDFRIGSFNENIKEEVKIENEIQKFRFLDISSIVFSNDGSVLIVGEQRYVVQKQGNNAGADSSYYKNIIVTKINPDESIAWIRNLPKYQRSKIDKKTMSYTYLSKENNHYFLFLGNIENLNLPEDMPPHKHTYGYGGHFMTYTINDETGKVKKEAIFNIKNIQGTELKHFETDKILKLSDSEILLEDFKRKSENFLVKIKVEE